MKAYDGGEGFIVEWIKSLLGGKVKYLLLGIILLAAGVCGVSAGMELWKEWHTPPEQIVGEALMYAAEAPVYGYTSEAVHVLDGKETVISRLNGQKNGENIHLFGSVDVVDSQIDVYQIGDLFYRQDIVSGSWMQMTGQNLEATEHLLQEINPLGCLILHTNAEVTELEKETVNDVKCRKFQVRSSGESSYMTSVWNEFYYTLWIDKQHRLQKAEVIAGDHEHQGEQLKLNVMFDWNAVIEDIKAPV